MSDARRTVAGIRISIVLLVASVLFGAFLGALATRWAKRLPNDLERTSVILSALRSPETPPGTAIFGDSVMMSGVDARIVQARTGATRPVWNLSSTGQTLAESLLYYQELPSSVSAIVQAVRVPRLVATRDLAFNTHVANTFNIHGYRPDADTIRILTRAFGPESVEPLLANAFRATFESRWLIRQYVDTSFRQVIRSDLDASRALRDLAYPQPFTRPLEADKLRLQIDQSRVADACGGTCAWRANYLAALHDLREACARRGRRYVVLLSPIHPALHDLYAAVFSRLAADIDAGTFGPRADVIDATRLLEAADFFDFQHPTPVGADKLSRLVASTLGSR